MKNQLMHNKVTIFNTFLISMVMATFLYRISGMSEAMNVLEESSLLISLTEVFSTVYISMITTIILICLHYLFKDHLPSEAMNDYEAGRHNAPKSPKIVSNNPTLQKEILDQVNVH